PGVQADGGAKGRERGETFRSRTEPGCEDGSDWPVETEGSRRRRGSLEGNRAAETGEQASRSRSRESGDSRSGTIGGSTAGGDRFCRTSLASSRGVRPTQERQWRNGIFKVIEQKMQVQGSLALVEMCQLSGVSRASYYRRWQAEKPNDEEMVV